jgi:hypothetical protein
MRRELKTLADLGELQSGAVEALFEQQRAAVFEDCMASPALDKPRLLTLKVSFTPIVDDSGALAGVRTQCEIGTKLPSFNTQEIIGRAHDKALVYDDLSPRDPAQQTLPMGGPAAGKAREEATS